MCIMYTCTYKKKKKTVTNQLNLKRKNSKICMNWKEPYAQNVTLKKYKMYKNTVKIKND